MDVTHFDILQSSRFAVLCHGVDEIIWRSGAALNENDVIALDVFDGLFGGHDLREFVGDRVERLWGVVPKPTTLRTENVSLYITDPALDPTSDGRHDESMTHFES